MGHLCISIVHVSITRSMFICDQIPASTIPDNLHRTDLRSVFHLYQPDHPEWVSLLLSTFTWTLVHFVHSSHMFSLNQLTLVQHQPGRCITSMFLSSLCTHDKPDLDSKSQGSMLSFLPRCQGLLAGCVASGCLFQGLCWRY